MLLPKFKVYLLSIPNSEPILKLERVLLANKMKDWGFSLSKKSSPPGAKYSGLVVELK